MYDLKYNNCTKEDFYNISPEVYESGAKVRHIGIEEIDVEKELIQEEYGLTDEEADLFLGNGYARARNTIMYFALKNNIDYLLYWDDDEYPMACELNDNKIKWIKQNNVATHLRYIKDANITFGYRCGYNSPVPHIDFSSKAEEKNFANFIDGVSNEAVNWKNVKENMKNNGISYADSKILNSNKAIQLYGLGVEEWLLGSGLCINLKDIEKVPAFYNPAKARGEDAFFSTLLSSAKVLHVPTYHFHDSFLKYTDIMKNSFPQELGKMELDSNVEKRFLDACIGWIKYKPLLMYITRRNEYAEKIIEIKEKLEQSIPKINEMFPNSNFDVLLEELDRYDKEVKNDYREYIRTNNIWNKIKNKKRSIYEIKQNKIKILF